MKTTTRYACFISYKHGIGNAADVSQRGDSIVARMLQDQLHRIARPFWKLRALHVFRDEAELAAGPDLPGRIQAALQASEYFVLLASPQSAISPWVRKEVREWLLFDPQGERLILGLTEGDLLWKADGDARIGRLSGNAIAPELSETDLCEPQWIDLRAYRRTELSHHAGFRRSCIEIAARLHGCTPDALAGQDHRRLRQTVSALSMGLVLLSGATSFALWQRGLALDRGAMARAGQLALESQIAQLRDPEEAAPLLAGALDVLKSRDLPVDYDVELALRSGADVLRDELRFSTEQMASRTIIHNTSEMIAVTSDQVQRLHPRTGRHLSLPLTDVDGYPLGVQTTARTADGGMLLVAKTLHGEVRLHRLLDKEWRLQTTRLPQVHHPMGLAVGGARIYVTDRHHGVYAYDRGVPEPQHWAMPSAGLIACGVAANWRCVVADRSPGLIGTAITKGSVIKGNARLHLLKQQAVATESTETPHLAVSALLWTGSTLVSGGTEGLIQKYIWVDEQLQRDAEPIRGLTSAVTALASTKGRMAAGSHDGLIRVWGDSAEAEHTLRGHVAAIRALAFEEGSDCGLWSLSEDGQIRRWELCWPIQRVDSTKSWETQSSDGSWLGRASMTDVELVHNGSSTRRSVRCAVAANRMVEILAISNRGDVLVKCPGTQARQAAEWLRADATQESIAYPEDQYRLAWFVGDDELIVVTGSFYSTVDGLDVGDRVFPASLQRWRAGMKAQRIDLRAHGLGLSLALSADGQLVYIGTEHGKLLTIRRENFSTERVFELGPIFDPNGQARAVKALACCSSNGLAALAYGQWGSPATMAEQMRDRMVLFDPVNNQVDASHLGERRSTLALHFLARERIVAIHGPIDAQDGYGDSARLRMFDLKFRPLGVDIALQGKMYADVASVGSEQISVIALPRGRFQANLALEDVEARIRSVDHRRRRIIEVTRIDAEIRIARAAQDDDRIKALASQRIAASPETTDGWHQRGLARLALGELEAAASDFEAVLERDPTNLYAPLDAAMAYALLENGELAEAMLNATIERWHLIVRPPAIDVETDHPNYARMRALAMEIVSMRRKRKAEPLLMRAEVRLLLGNRAGAREDLNEVNELGVDNATSQRLRAALAHADGQQSP